MALPRTLEPPLPLLPRQSKFVVLLISETHHKMFHLGTDTVITEILQKYKTRSVLTTCVTCRRYHGRPYQVNEGLLAPFRSHPSEPFAYTGPDFAGPIYVLKIEKKCVFFFSHAQLLGPYIWKCVQT